MSLFVSRIISKESNQLSPEALHIVIPHCVNWRLTQACVEAFARLTESPHSITVVNNFDVHPFDSTLLKIANVTLIEHRRTKLGELVQRIYRKRNGSKENALALDAALYHHPDFKWAFMAHSDSAPMLRGWEKFYFSALNGSKIIGNYRDRIRIHAAHASGTLFSQSDFVKHNASMRPQYKFRKQVLDVGDRATVVLHDLNKGPVPALPNTINQPELIEKLEKDQPLLASFAKDGSCVTFDQNVQLPVLVHLGRGTPRSLKDPNFDRKLPQDIWIELLAGLK